VNVMKEIPLTKGKVAVIDDEDYESLARHRWITQEVRPTYKGRVYASKFYARASCRGPALLMHRLITSAPKGMDVDHIDGDGLNNRRCNLRICTRSQNQRNKRVANRNGFCGVVFKAKKKTNQYAAQITVDKKTVYVGYFDTAERAARAADSARYAIAGEFAKLNFPREMNQAAETA
jgi:hypothetical protein